MKRQTSQIFILFLILTVLSGMVSCKSSKNQAAETPSVVERIHIEVDYSDKRKLIVEEALAWIGVPYLYAGYSKAGTDCSGMVLRIYEDITGIKIPRNSAKQAEFCEDIGREAIKPGDLVFFATGTDPERISHVGIMIDAERFVHASTKKGVVVSSLDTPYYQRTLRKFGRVSDI